MEIKTSMMYHGHGKKAQNIECKMVSCARGVITAEHIMLFPSEHETLNCLCHTFIIK